MIAIISRACWMRYPHCGPPWTRLWHGTRCERQQPNRISTHLPGRSQRRCQRRNLRRSQILRECETAIPPHPRRAPLIGRKPMGYARHIGRVGALAITLEVGIALGSSAGVAYAEPSSSSSTSGSSSKSASLVVDRPGKSQEEVCRSQRLVRVGRRLPPRTARPLTTKTPTTPHRRRGTNPSGTAIQPRGRFAAVRLIDTLRPGR